MKIRAEVTIDADRDTVWRTFDDPDNMPRWQPTLKSVTHQTGTPGEPGAVAELVYDENGKKVVMTETITEKRKPDFMAGIYESAVGNALIVNHFEAIGENTTRWAVYANHRFKGIMKLLALFAGKSVRNRTEADLQRFKLLVETDLARGSR